MLVFTQNNCSHFELNVSLHSNVNAFFTALLLLYDVTNKASFDNIRVGHHCLISVWLTKAGKLYAGFGKWHNL